MKGGRSAACLSSQPPRRGPVLYSAKHDTTLDARGDGLVAGLGTSVPEGMDGEAVLGGNAVNLL